MKQDEQTVRRTVVAGLTGVLATAGLLLIGAEAAAARLFELQSGIPSPVEGVNSEGVAVIVPEHPQDLGGLCWVWSAEPDQPDFGLNAYYLTEFGVRGFRRVIRLDKAERVFFVAAASGKTDLLVNGRRAVDELAPAEVAVQEVTGLIRNGANVFAVRVDNRMDHPAIDSSSDRKRAGLIGRVIAEYADGKQEIFPIDKTWLVSRDPDARWLEGAGADGEQPVVTGPYGIDPWGQLSGPLLAPPSFPTFKSEQAGRELELLRELGLRYYRYGCVPTYKDMWLPECYLWVGLTDPGEYDRNEALWKQALLTTRRRIDEAGYVSTDQHLGLGHPRGWPFPFWVQAGGAGWPFSFAGFHYLERIPNYRPADPSLWLFEHAELLGQCDPEGIELKLTDSDAVMVSPTIKINHRVSPFFTMEWDAADLKGRAAPYLEWTTAAEPEFSQERRVSFSFDPAARGRQRSLATLYKHPEYAGPITRFRIGFGNEVPGDIRVKILFTTQDTRHNGNNAQFIGGVYQVAAYTGDREFLAAQMPRVRKALRFALDEFGIEKYKHVHDPWIGHEGRSGIEYVKGKRMLHRDRGMGNNFWDLLPFGGHDFYSSMLYHEAILRMAEMEAWAREAGVPGEGAFDPVQLRQLAAEMKAHANEFFWVDETGRFPSAVDFDGRKWDYGFTFVNLEAIYYGFADESRSKSIMSWINGDRFVPSDTAPGRDIYFFRFAPRTTTLRNVDYYKFAWAAPDRHPYGGQIQDGGAVLGFSFHDLMARHRVLGPDNAWQRLKEILAWYEEVWNEGGYMPYYAKNEGTLQSPKPGGLGLHREFTEPALLPLYVLQGLFGFDAKLDGFALDPRFPKALGDFTVDRIRYQDARLSLHRKDDTVQVRVDQGSAEGLSLYLPAGDWQIGYYDGARQIGATQVHPVVSGGGKVPLSVNGSRRVVLRSVESSVAK